MIRISLLSLIVTILAVYAWKDWYKSLCGLIILMSVFQHPDMPKAILDIPGLNLWNVLFMNVVLSWWISRKKEGLTWDMPSVISKSLTLYIAVIVISVIRLLLDDSALWELANIAPAPFEPMSALSSINEYLLNAIKWIVPGILIFDGCRSHARFRLAIAVLMLLYFFLGLLTIKAVGLGSLRIGGEDLQERALKVINSNVGYSRVNMSMMLSGAFWAIFSAKEVANKKQFFFLIVPICLVVFVGQALTGGRTGYLTWGLVGGILCMLRWRRYILFAPFVLLAVAVLAPSAVDRLSQGLRSEIGEETQESRIDRKSKESQDEVGLDTVALTSGRTAAWEWVIEAIEERPFVGYGREGMRNGARITTKMLQAGVEAFAHPHNMYLQWVLDNGFIGSIPVLIFFYVIIKYSFSLFLDHRNPIFPVVGGVCVSLTLAMLIAGMGSQSFYPREGSVGMWVGLGLMLRIYVDRSRLLNKRGDLPTSPEDFWIRAEPEEHTENDRNVYSWR